MGCYVFDSFFYMLVLPWVLWWVGGLGCEFWSSFWKVHKEVKVHGKMNLGGSFCGSWCVV